MQSDDAMCVSRYGAWQLVIYTNTSAHKNDRRQRQLRDVCVCADGLVTFSCFLVFEPYISVIGTDILARMSYARGWNLFVAMVAAISTLVVSVQLAMSVFPDRRSKVDNGNSPMVNTAVASLAPIVIIVLLGGVIALFYRMGTLALTIIDSILHKKGHYQPTDKADLADRVSTPAVDTRGGYNQLSRKDTRANNLFVIDSTP